jgi:hypothetical protein
MARDVQIRCDRCGDLCESGVSVLAPEAGPLRKRRATPYDLCERCGKGFVAWLNPELPTLEPTEPAPTPCA